MRILITNDDGYSAPGIRALALWAKGMNVNFGLFPLISGEITQNGKFRKIKGMEWKILYCKRALVDIKSWIEKIRTA